jgi:hypothetical protein
MGTPSWVDGTFPYRSRLESVARADVAETLTKDREYHGSWQKRGGVGAFMMMARKWDRIEPQVAAFGYDVFAACRTDTRAEGLRDDIRDLRRYLMLVEAWLQAEDIDRVAVPVEGDSLVGAQIGDGSGLSFKSVG